MSHPLSPLARQLAAAEIACAQALQAQREARAALHDARLRVEQLTLYRQGYNNRWGAEIRSSGNARMLAEHQEFIDHLDFETDVRQAQIEAAAQVLDTASRVLRERELRVAAIKEGVTRQCTLPSARPSTGLFNNIELALTRCQQTILSLPTFDASADFAPA